MPEVCVYHSKANQAGVRMEVMGLRRLEGCQVGGAWSVLEEKKASVLGKW